eukprot:1141469-Pelagomonas_calceolata.AAC.5
MCALLCCPVISVGVHTPSSLGATACRENLPEVARQPMRELSPPATIGKEVAIMSFIQPTLCSDDHQPC